MESLRNPAESEKKITKDENEEFDNDLSNNSNHEQTMKQKDDSKNLNKDEQSLISNIVIEKSVNLFCNYVQLTQHENDATIHDKSDVIELEMKIFENKTKSEHNMIQSQFQKHDLYLVLENLKVSGESLTEKAREKYRRQNIGIEEFLNIKNEKIYQRMKSQKKSR